MKVEVKLDGLAEAALVGMAKKGDAVEDVLAVLICDALTGVLNRATPVTIGRHMRPGIRVRKKP